MVVTQPPLHVPSSLCRRQDWGDTTGVAQRVSDAKEPIYQRLTAAGISAFPGVAALVEQVRGGRQGGERTGHAGAQGQAAHGALHSCLRRCERRPRLPASLPLMLRASLSALAQARRLGWGVAVASSGSPDKIAHNLGSSGLAPLFPDVHLVRHGRLRRGGLPL